MPFDELRAMRTLLATICLFLALTPAAYAQKLDTSGVDRAVQKVMAFDALQKSKVGIVAVDVETNELVYAMNADEPFNPASNMKLLTAAAALETMGPEHVFVTRLGAKGDGPTIDGPLYLEGGGDPLLMWEDLLAMASELKALGVTKITGGVVVDDSAFGGGFTPPGFDQKDEDASYRAPVGAASLNYNSQTVVVRPGAKSGDPARFYLLPPNDNVQIENKISTAAGTRAKIGSKAVADGDGTKITLTGSIGQNAEAQYVRKRIDNPTLFSGSAMLAALRAAGIEAEGPVKAGKRPNGAKTLVMHESPSLAYVVFLMNKWSNNFLAEMLFKMVGSGGKTADASRSPAFVEKFLSKAGVKTKGFKSLNGSGLYTGNLITPRQIVELLDWMVDQPTYPEFAASLPTAGRDGTLAKRLANPITRNTLRGKTGTLNEVTALSGYLRTKSGRTLAYAVLINDPPVRAWTLRRVQDELAEALAGFDK